MKINIVKQRHTGNTRKVKAYSEVTALHSINKGNRAYLRDTRYRWPETY